jgi:aryl-alcohol dehydrogenase-like predicted oxidoreductase
MTDQRYLRRRQLGRTGFEVSEVGFGGWAIGADWGRVPSDDAIAAIHAALDEGVNFFDTADVYGDGLSERRLAQVRAERGDAEMIVATKAGRRLQPHVADGYTPENIERFVDRSLENLDTEALDLLQLHCPPTDVYYRPELFAGLDALVAEGKIRHYGVSVEKVEEALKAIEYPGVETVQIIFNIFRQRPAGLFFREAAERDVGVIVRVPLASGLLSGRMSRSTTFGDDDHRGFNRHGEAFDVGETFAGIDFDTGLAAVEELRRLVPDRVTMAQLAIRWILMHPAVSTVIPGARRPAQAIENARAAALSPLDNTTMAAISDVYERFARAEVHHRW